MEIVLNQISSKIGADKSKAYANAVAALRNTYSRTKDTFCRTLEVRTLIRRLLGRVYIGI